MKVLMVMYKSGLPLDQIRNLFKTRARKYARVDGLREKLYVEDTATGEVGGIYVFDSEASLRKFRQSGFEQDIADTYRARFLTIRELRVVMSLRNEPPQSAGAA